MASAPAMTPSIAAASAAVRVIGPIWSSESDSGNTPWRLTRPQVGLSPVTPLALEGKRIDPPVSEPSEPKQSPAAVATPEPEDEAPDQCAGCHGLSGGWMAGWWSANAPSVICSLPSETAPATRSRSTTVASMSGCQSLRMLVPQAVVTPLVKHRSLTAIGTPWRGPR